MKIAQQDSKRGCQRVWVVIQVALVISSSLPVCQAQGEDAFDACPVLLRKSSLVISHRTQPTCQQFDACNTKSDQFFTFAQLLFCHFYFLWFSIIQGHLYLCIEELWANLIFSELTAI